FGRAMRIGRAPARDGADAGALLCAGSARGGTGHFTLQEAPGFSRGEDSGFDRQPQTWLRDRREGRRRKRLIPVGNAAPVVAACVGVAVFDGHLDGLLKDDRIGDMPAIAGGLAAPEVAALRVVRYEDADTMIEAVGNVLHSVGMAEIVLCAGPVQRRLLI